MDKFYHEMLRAKQKVLVTVGSAQKTVDASYDEEKKKSSTILTSWSRN